MKSIFVYKSSKLSGLITNITLESKNTYIISTDKTLCRLIFKNSRISISNISNISNISSIAFIDSGVYCLSTLNNGCKISIENRIYGKKRIFKGYDEIYSLFSKKNKVYIGGKFGQFSIFQNGKFKSNLKLASILNYGEGKIVGISKYNDSLIAISFEQRFAIFNDHKPVYIFPYHAKSHLITDKFIYIGSSTDIVEIPLDSISKVTLKFKEYNNSILIEHAAKNITQYSKSPWIRTNSLFKDSNNVII